MRTTLLTSGRAKAPFAEAEAHYLKLLSPHIRLELVEARDDRALLRRVPSDCWLVAIDHGGKGMDSIAWSRWLEGRRLAATELWIAIGGADGLPGELLARADEAISLGPQTMAHQLARIVVLEQLFRAARILAGEPYHR
jgi:23S rRNA (pseudouridine1915-N3)-methyltransferase